jgi:hypothetical protein
MVYKFLVAEMACDRRDQYGIETIEAEADGKRTLGKDMI